MWVVGVDVTISTNVHEHGASKLSQSNLMVPMPPHTFNVHFFFLSATRCQMCCLWKDSHSSLP